MFVGTKSVILPCCLKSGSEIRFVLLARFPIEVANYVIEAQLTPFVALDLVENFPKLIYSVTAQNRLLVASTARIGTMSEEIYTLRFEEVQREIDLVV